MGNILYFYSYLYSYINIYIKMVSIQKKNNWKPKSNNKANKGVVISAFTIYTNTKHNAHDCNMENP